MGLAISKSIVESHGGRIWANGYGRRGARFHFTLPRRLPLQTIRRKWSDSAFLWTALHQSGGNLSEQSNALAEASARWDRVVKMGGQGI